jgi:hypothetical protein
MKHRLAGRWDKIVIHAREVDWGNASVGLLASEYGRHWFATRTDEPVAGFLVHGR